MPKGRCNTMSKRPSSGWSVTIWAKSAPRRASGPRTKSRAELPMTPTQITTKLKGMKSEPTTNCRTVRPREILARNSPTKAAQVIHHAQKNKVQAFSQESGRFQAKVSRVQEGKTATRSPMLPMMASTRKRVRPVTKAKAARTPARTTLAEQRNLMPWLMSVRAETQASPIPTSSRATWVGRPDGRPKTTCRPADNCTTPTPREVAIPNIPPTIAAASTRCPHQPSARRPRTGRSVERRDKSWPRRKAK